MNPKEPKNILREDFIILEDIHADSHDESIILDENTLILPAGDAYSLFDMDKVRSAFHKSGLSYDEVAEMKDISVSSIYKFMSKKSKSPSLYNSVMIFQALDISMDDLFGFPPKKTDIDTKTIADMKSMMETISALQNTVESLQNTIETQNNLIRDLISAVNRTSPASGDDY